MTTVTSNVDVIAKEMRRGGRGEDGGGRQGLVDVMTVMLSPLISSGSSEDKLEEE